MKYPEGLDQTFDETRVRLGSAVRRLGHAVIGREVDIESMEDARYLVDAIISHQIDYITLENCFGEDINGYEILRSLFASGRNTRKLDVCKALWTEHDPGHDSHEHRNSPATGTRQWVERRENLHHDFDTDGLSADMRLVVAFLLHSVHHPRG